MEQESDLRPKISDAVGEFLHDLDGIKSAEEIACSLIQALAKKSAKTYQELLAEFETEADEDSENPTVLVPVERNREFRAIQRQHKLTDSAIYQTPRALLVAMVSSFDAYLGRLLRCIYYLRPERIDSSERTLTFSQLVSLESVDAAREHVISKEIETFLRKSHVEHFVSLEKLLDIPLRKGLDSWPLFVELTQRRNLFVHSDGVVSDQYISACQENNVELREVKIGDQLYLDDIYFRNAFECLYEIGVKLAHVVWRKLSPEQLEDSDINLNRVCYELLQLKRFRLAHSILHFATDSIKKHSSAFNRRMLIVNRAIAVKFGRIQSDPSPLELEDWSDCGLPFQLALAVLNDDFNRACEIMIQLGTEHELVDRTAYGNWPLFMEFREDGGFLETYRALFGSEFNVTSTSGSPDKKSEQPYETEIDSESEGP